MLQNRTILQGDVLENLKKIPENSIDTIITSPPYWGLRDYKVDGQWGLEEDFHDYLKLMQTFMNHLKIVLKPTGTCWINLGDTYAGGVAHGDWSRVDHAFHSEAAPPARKFKGQVKHHVKAKSRYGIPERFYADCIDNGWIARNHVPWYKSNSMPQSVKDRFTNKWESVFFFAKEPKYYFNLDAVRIPITSKRTKPFNLRVREAKAGKGQMKLGEKGWKAADWEIEEYNDKGERKQDNTMGADGKPKANYVGFNQRWNDKFSKHYDKNGNCLGCGEPWNKHTVSERAKGSMSEAVKRSEDIVWCNPKGKNPGDVFFINPHAFPEAHFAAFPVELPIKILKCACPPGGIVLDPFFGAGTVGLAAEILGRNWIGIELNEEYIRIARKRLEPYNIKRLDQIA